MTETGSLTSKCSDICMTELLVGLARSFRSTYLFLGSLFNFNLDNSLPSIVALRFGTIGSISELSFFAGLLLYLEGL